MSEKYLIHYGVKGQQWGERNYQYEDGSLTPEGKLRYYGKNYAKGMQESNNAYYSVLAKNRSAFTKNKRTIRNSDITLSERRSAIRGEKHAMKAANKKAFNNTVERQAQILKKTSYGDIWVESLKRSSYGVGSILVGKMLQTSGNDTLNLIGAATEGFGQGWIEGNVAVAAVNSLEKHKNEN